MTSSSHFFFLHLSTNFFQASYVQATGSFTQNRALQTASMKIFYPLAIKLACFGVLIRVLGQDARSGKAGIVHLACIVTNLNFVQVTKFPKGLLKMIFYKRDSIFFWGISYILGNKHTFDPFRTQYKLNPIVKIVWRSHFLSWNKMFFL